jgi:hypothetical protein
MSLPGVSTTISGMDSMRVLDQNLEILRNFKPLSEQQIGELRSYAQQFDDGRYELFKSTCEVRRRPGPPAARLSQRRRVACLPSTSLAKRCDLDRAQAML